jgi:hypothetical protein
LSETKRAISPLWITLADSEVFAQLSGDFNPIHVDPMSPRKASFGFNIVHGIHLVLSVFDQMSPEIWVPSQVKSLRVRFLKPLAHGAQASISIAKNESSFDATILNGEVKVLSLKAELEPDQDSYFVPMTRFEKKNPVSAPIKVGDSVTEDLCIGEVDLEKIFAHKLRHISKNQISELLAMTRVVGMKLPGLRSVLAGLNLEFGKDEARTDASVRVQNFHEKLNYLELQWHGPRLQGSIEVIANK